MTPNSTQNTELRSLPDEVEMLSVGIIDDTGLDADTVKQGWYNVAVRLSVWEPVRHGRPLIRIGTETFATTSLTADDLIQALIRLPDARLLKSVTAIEYPHPYQRQLRRETRNQSLVITSMSDEDGTVTLFLDIEKGPTIYDDLTNAFSKCLRQVSSPEVVEGFDQWYEANGFVPLASNILCRSSSETWAELGSLLLREDVSAGIITAEANPVLAALWGLALFQVLRSRNEDQSSPNYQRHLKVANYLTTKSKEAALLHLDDAVDTPKEVIDTVRTCLMNSGSGD